MSTIDQKEYLKRYLSTDGDTDKKKKRKKKKAKTISSRVKIIDDDADEHIFNEAVQEDLLAMNEDAPQIVGVIDERPLELRIDDFREDGAWEVVSTGDAPFGYKRKERQRDRDASPLRNTDRNQSPPANRANHSVYSPKGRGTPDNSPPRKKVVDDNSPPRKSRKDSSPPRIKKNKSFPSEKDKSPLREKISNDYSPPRKSRRDNSPPRRRKDETNKKSVNSKHNSVERFSPSPRRNYIDDCSPPRKHRKGPGSPTKGDRSPIRHTKNIDSTPPRRNSNTDNSPPRKKRGRDESPPRVNKSNDSSPPRRNRSNDNSPPKRSHNSNQFNNLRGNSPLPNNTNLSEKGKTESSASSLKRDEEKRSQRKSRWEQPDKMTKTLDGKAAGLQSASNLTEETKAFKKREDELFNTLSAEVSGVNAATIMRDRKTGKIRDLQREAEKQKEKEEQQAVIKEKYDKWGKGTKQVEDYNEKLQQDVYEMSKPLARYADDEDIERYLKEQEREGDPMLAYLRKKKKKEAVESGKPMKPQFEGEFMPNRFGIRPGHKWDGRDRSNGYEKKWFEVQNAKQAQREEVYKWSTEDM